jgi:hypothetical protein
MRRIGHALLPLVALTLLLLGGAFPAAADGPPPIVPPPGVSGPPAGAVTPKPGPTYVITPGSSGSSLGSPKTKSEVEKAKNAFNQTRTQAQNAKKSASQGRSGVAPQGVSGTATTPKDLTTAASNGHELAWLMAGSGALLLLVLTDFFRIGFRRIR